MNELLSDGKLFQSTFEILFLGAMIGAIGGSINRWVWDKLARETGDELGCLMWPTLLMWPFTLPVALIVVMVLGLIMFGKDKDRK